MSVTLNGTSGLVFSDGTIQGTAAGNSFRNRIINGDMRIDQRNNGAAVTAAQFSYTLDRWNYGASQPGKLSFQRLTGAPGGHTHYMRIATVSAYTPVPNEIFNIRQIIEAQNMADFMYGTSSASPASLSFWVRSSIAGNFGGSLLAPSPQSSYPFLYNISQANTWEYKTISILPSTFGGIEAGNLYGCYIQFSLGGAGTALGTPGQWNNNVLNYGATGQTNIVTTNGATLDITGVQFEKAAAATSFEHRPIGTELAMCQRYYYRLAPKSVSRTFGIGQVLSATTVGFPVTFPTTMRDRPASLEQSGTPEHYAALNATGTTVNCSSVPIYNNATNAQIAWLNFIFSSGFVAGNAAGIWTASDQAFLGWSAEL
jgi:hypothetical protein